jgi:dihydrofolate reductase
MGMISMVVAMDKNNGIGKDNKLLWHLPQDLRYFKELTQGYPIIIGRKTYESIVSKIGKPLPNRLNIVMTRDRDYPAPKEVIVSESVDMALTSAKYFAKDIFVIGGSTVYEQFMPYVDRLYVTEIDEEFEVDAYFPQIDQSVWKEDLSKRLRGRRDNKNPYKFYFKVYNKLLTSDK